ncbi:glycosyltransferase [Klebsiella pneumoniae]|uniref:glycosyltransferase n=1 Tax=Klebsiella pneumoniae TaxID=573 RepID=UPI0027D20BE3|nr:glycosyltransferase [Klebsiella pneumoniae]
MTKSISVYIPTHNRPVFLQRALCSLTEQKYKNFQVVICDDGSTDNNYKTVKSIVDEYKTRFNDLVLLRNDTPMGACFTRNRAIECSDGYFITGLDDDDEFTPYRLKKFVESDKLNKYPYLSSGHITDSGSYRSRSPSFLDKETDLESLLFSNVVGNQVFTEKKLIMDIGGFDNILPSWQDYDLWIRLTKTYGCGYKIAAHTYVLNIAHELNRITTSEKVKKGYELFLEKHRDLLKKEHYQSLAFQDLMNRSKTLNLSFFINNCNKNTFMPLIKYNIRSRYPLLSKMFKIILARTI